MNNLRAGKSTASSSISNCGRGVRLLSWVVCAVFTTAGFFAGTQTRGQHAHANPASLTVQVNPAVQLIPNGPTNVSLSIRLRGGATGNLWGDSTTSCNSPIANALTYSSSSHYDIPLATIPFTTSDSYVCAYDPGATPASAYVVWPHTDASLKVSTQPANAIAGAALSPPVAVEVFDTNGILDTTSTASITIAISTGTGSSGATLSGTLTRPAVNGVATFNDLSINKVGTGYKLIATSGPLSSATSTSFNISPGTPTQLVFTTQPGGGTAGVAWSIQPAVTVEDAYGNVVNNSTASVTLKIATNSGGGTLTCAGNPKTASSGVATFTGCSISLGGAAYKLQATALGLASATSASFNVQDFTLSANPSSLTIDHIKASGSITISLNNLGGFTGTVALSCTVTSPVNNNGLSCSGTNPDLTFSPGTISGSGTSEMSKNPRNTKKETYTVTVTGTSASLSRSTTVVITVN